MNEPMTEFGKHYVRGPMGGSWNVYYFDRRWGPIYIASFRLLEKANEYTDWKNNSLQ